MEYYYWKENVYDDLRKALFTRNLTIANVISIFLLLFAYVFWYISFDKVYILIGGLLVVLTILYWYTFKKQIQFYLFKLLMTYFYLTCKLKEDKSILNMLLKSNK